MVVIKKRVLITGAGGRIGQVLSHALKDRYKLRLMFHKVIPSTEEEAIIADITNFDSIIPAMKNIDAVIHLAGLASERFPWRQMLEANIVGTYNVFEAARQSGIKKIVFASTNHVTGFWEKEGVYINATMPIRPDGLYAVTKAFGEALARYYVDQFNMSIICLRIGSFVERDHKISFSGRLLATWISDRDLVQLVWRSIETDLKFGIFYGVSDNTRKIWDINDAKNLLGYAPEDNAENYAEERQ